MPHNIYCITTSAHQLDLAFNFPCWRKCYSNILAECSHEIFGNNAKEPIRIWAWNWFCVNANLNRVVSIVLTKETSYKYTDICFSELGKPWQWECNVITPPFDWKLIMVLQHSILESELAVHIKRTILFVQARSQLIAKKRYKARITSTLFVFRLFFWRKCYANTEFITCCPLIKRRITDYCITEH